MTRQPVEERHKAAPIRCVAAPHRGERTVRRLDVIAPCMDVRVRGSAHGALRLARADACAVVRGSAPLRHEGRWLTRDLSRCPDVPMGFGSLRSSARARVYRFMRMSGHRDKSLETPVSWARGCPDMPNSIGTRSGHRDTNRRPRSARLEREGAITGPRVVAADGRATPGPRGAKPGVPTPSDARSLPTARWPSDLA